MLADGVIDRAAVGAIVIPINLSKFKEFAAFQAFLKLGAGPEMVVDPVLFRGTGRTGSIGNGKF
jgi:hypothetical protein